MMNKKGDHLHLKSTDIHMKTVTLVFIFTLIIVNTALAVLINGSST